MLEIVVNNETIDLDVSQTIGFDFQQNNFEDFTQIGGAKSTTITAIDTPKNRQIFSFANVLGSEGNVPYTDIDCIVRFHGIEVDGRAKMVLTGVSESGFAFNLFLFRSNLAFNIAEKTLQELSLGTTLAVNSNQNYSNTALDYINAFYDMQNGEGVGPGFQWWFLLKRSWKLKKLFTQIFADAGYTLATLPDELDWLDTHYLQGTPEYTSIEQAHKTYQDNNKGVLSCTNDSQFDAGSAVTSYQSIVSFDTVTTNAFSNFTTTYATLSNIYTYKLKVSISKVYSRDTPGGTKNYITDANIQIGYIDTFSVFQPITGTTIDNAGSSEIGSTISGAVVNNKVYVFITWSVALARRYFGIEAGSFFQVEVASYIPESIYNWIHAQDLPNQLQRNIVKSLLLLSGCTLKFDSYLNEVTIVSLADILQQSTVDWTSKIDFSELPNIAFSGQYAQNNYIRFRGTPDGQINYQVSNTNLQLVRNIDIDIVRVQNNLGNTALIDTRKQKLKFSEMEFVDATIDASFSEKQNQFHLFSDREQKKQDAFIGTVFSYPVAFIYRVPQVVARVASVNPIYVKVNPDPVNNVYYFNALQSLSQFQGNADLIADYLAGKYKKVTFKGYVSALDIANLPDVVYIGGNINQRFVLVSINEWQGENVSCTIQLLKIQNV